MPSAQYMELIFKSGHFSPSTDKVPIVQKAGWASRQAWTSWKIPPYLDGILAAP